MSGALDAGVTDVTRNLTEGAIHRTMRAMASSGASRWSALRSGLDDLMAALPACEEKLIVLHLDLGVTDPVDIAARISDEFLRRVSPVARSLASSVPAAIPAEINRESATFAARENG